jgi:hypothetical protein
MGYPGSSLDDYYSYELLDKVIEQIENGDTGDVNELSDRLSQAVEKFNKGIKQDRKVKRTGAYKHAYHR